MNCETYLRGLQMIVGNFNYPLSDLKIKLFEAELTDIDDEDFMAAILHLCRTREKIWPDENLVAVIRNQIERNLEDSAEEAWGKVLKEMNGGWANPIFVNPKIKAAVEVLGWKTICGTTEKDMNTLRAHFFRTYESIKKRDQVKETYRLIEDAKVRGMLMGIGKPKVIPSSTSSTQTEKS